MNWHAITWLTLTLCLWVLAFVFTFKAGYEEGKEEGFEEGKRYVRNILIQETDSLIKSQNLFPDNPRYQSLIDQWYKDGILPVKE